MQSPSRPHGISSFSRLALPRRHRSNSFFISNRVALLKKAQRLWCDSALQHRFSGTLPLPRGIRATSSLLREYRGGQTTRTTVTLRSPAGGSKPTAPQRSDLAAWQRGALLPLLQRHCFWGGTALTPAAQPAAGGTRSLGGVAGGFSGAVPSALAEGVCLHRGCHGHARGSCRHQQLRRIGKGQGFQQAAPPTLPLSSPSPSPSQTDMVFSLAPVCSGFLWAQPAVWSKSGAAPLSRESPACPFGHQVHTVPAVKWPR